MSKIQIKDYILEKSLGKGNFGEVFYSIGKDGKQFAIKRIQKDLYFKNGFGKKDLENEIKIVRSINNENIMKLVEHLESTNSYYLVFSYCNGKTLYDLMRDYKSKNSVIPQSLIYKFVKQMISALKCLKDNNVIHRDIKPENIGLHFTDEIDRINLNYERAKFILIDFGFAREGIGQTCVGTPLYQEPSLILMNTKSIIYDVKFDIWSLGCIIYELMSFSHPFYSGYSKQEFLQRLRKGDYVIPKSLEISNELLDLIEKCLKFKIDMRVDCSKILDLPFLKNEFCQLTYEKRSNDLILNIYRDEKKSLQDNDLILENLIEIFDEMIKEEKKMMTKLSFTDIALDDEKDFDRFMNMQSNVSNLRKFDLN